MNRPAVEGSEKFGIYNEAKAIGEKIKAESKPTEVIFSDVKEMSPQIVFYAQRNIRYASSPADAVQFLNARKSLQGRMFFH